ncbi:M20 family metallopeptidase [Tissierellaceae bacterium HCP3S3_D8]
MNIKELANKYRDYIIDLRREFHMYPESSWEEVRTSSRVKEELDKLEIPYISIAGTGVLATIKGKKIGKTVALRGDMDALETTETNDIPYKSKHDGKMHACGHDGHTAMLIGAANILNDIRDEINGTIHLIFQPAEEVAGGAKKIIEESNFMDEVDGIFGIHLWSDVEAGKVSVEAGPRMASADFFTIDIKGKAGHGSMPHQGIDAVVAASATVMNLQSVVSRELSPLDSATLTIGSFHSGTRFNIIAGDAKLEGTTRCFKPEIRENFPEIIERIAKNTAASYRAEATLSYTWGTPSTINDESCSKIATASVEKLLGKDGVVEMEKTTGGEDFAYFLEKAPGVFAFVGIRNEEKGACYPHHHDKFNMDEDALEIGAALYAQYAIDFLNN